jgi:hypothetical protein
MLLRVCHMKNPIKFFKKPTNPNSNNNPLSFFRFGNSEGVLFAILLIFNALCKPLKSKTYLIFRKVSQTPYERYPFFDLRFVVILNHLPAERGTGDSFETNQSDPC